MTEQQFLLELNEALKQLPVDEREDVIQDIKEYFQDGIEDGKSEEEIAASLGSPKAIAQDILPAYPVEKGHSSENSEVITISDENYTKIITTVQNGSLIVKPSTNSTTTIELKGKNDKLKLTAEVVGDTLNVNLKDKRRFFQFSFNFTPVTLTIYVPKKLYESMKLKSDNGRIVAEQLLSKSFEAFSDNGRIQLRQIAASTLSGETDNGRIELENVQSDIVKAKTDNGRIDLRNVDSQKISAESDNGRIAMENVAGAIVGVTDNGRITLHTTGLDRHIEFRTDNGSILIEAEKEPTNVTINAKTGNGKIDIFGDSSKRTVIGTGDNKINVVSGNGRITIVSKQLSKSL